MSDGERTAEDQIAEYSKIYSELIGLVPPRIQARLKVSSDIDPGLLAMQEEVRERAMYPEVFDVKTAQLILWGILLGQMGNGARWHGMAARRAGATWEELHAVAGLAYLFRGLPAMNLAAELLAEMRENDPLEEA